MLQILQPDTEQQSASLWKLLDELDTEPPFGRIDWAEFEHFFTYGLICCDHHVLGDTRKLSRATPAQWTAAGISALVTLAVQLVEWCCCGAH